MIREIKTINCDTFAPYGDILAFRSEPTSEPFFEVICSVASSGWRIALYQVKSKSTDELERHSGSRESFEPLGGTGLLLVGEADNPDEYEVFLLDKPVCLHAGIWHQLISLGEECTVKIMENDEVTTDFHKLPGPVNAVVQTGYMKNENAQ